MNGKPIRVPPSCTIRRCRISPIAQKIEAPVRGRSSNFCLYPTYTICIVHQVALGDEIGGWAANEQAHFVGAKPSSQGCSGAKPRILRPPSHSASPSSCPAEVAINLGLHSPQCAETGQLRARSSFLSRERSTDGRPATTSKYGGGGGGAYSMVVFALSPSGRALMLTVPQAATVLDAKAQLAVGCVY